MNDSLVYRSGHLNRSMPSDEEAEKCIVAGILLDNDLLLECLESLTVHDFYGVLHRQVYGIMLEIFQTGRKIDPIIIIDEMKRQGINPDTFGGTATITNLMYGIPHFTSLTYYIDIVIEKSRARKLIQICGLSQTSALGDEEFKLVLDQHEQLIGELRNKDTVNHFVQLNTAVKETYDQISTFAKSGGKDLLGITTGFQEIDTATSGLEKSDLIILAARPSMGKTALGLQMVRRAAADPNTVCAIFSLEMSRQQLTQRLIASEAGVDLMRMRRGMLTNPEWGRVAEASSLLSSLKVVIDDTPALTTMQIKAKIRRLLSEWKKLDMVMIDHGGLIKHAGPHSQSEHHKISGTMKEIKAMAKEFELPFLVLYQLSRAVEKRNPPRPMMSDLRESGSIEEDADKIFMIYRPEYYLKEKCPEADRGMAEILIEKNRNGPTVPVKLTFLKQFARFENHSGGN